MASKESLAIMRETELNRLTAVAGALAQRFDLAVPAFPARGKDPELLRVAQVRWMADTLESVNAVADAEKATKAPALPKSAPKTTTAPKDAS